MTVYRIMYILALLLIMGMINSLKPFFLEVCKEWSSVSNHVTKSNEESKSATG